MATAPEPKPRSRRAWYRAGAFCLGGALVAAGVWLACLMWRVEAGFPSLDDAPSRIYSRPLRLYVGMDPSASRLGAYLGRVGYPLVSGPAVRLGEFAVRPDGWTVGVRPFRHAGGRESGGVVVAHLGPDGKIDGLRYAYGRTIDRVLIEPAEIAAIRGPDQTDRIIVRLGDVPHYLVDAVLAIEDRRFFEHPGIDLRRIGASTLANVRAGRLQEGASTITQQLVKIAFLGQRRTFRRKVNEIVMAILVELRHRKNDILEAYLNAIYLGQDGAVAIHGVGLAARHFFGKDVAALDLEEAALLAGMIHAPSVCSPFRHPDAALRRRNLVLRVMREQKKITEREYRRGVQAALVVRPAVPDVPSPSYFVDFLLTRLAARHGDEMLTRRGFSIYTTLDLGLQAQAEAVVRGRLEDVERDFPSLRRRNFPLQAAMVVLEPHSGQLLSMVGGRDYRRSTLNRAVFSSRQPGSTFKPVVVLTALRSGFTLASVLPDEPFGLRGPRGMWNPINHDARFRNRVTVREALEQSLNVPMVHLADSVGRGNVISTARRLGFESRLEPVPSLPLGTLEITRAYGVLAAQGTRAPLRLVLGMTDRDGRPRDGGQPRPLQVFSRAETYLVTSALQGAADRGTAAALREYGYDGAVAGKTGTTDAFRDGWFVGYTPEIALGVWVGFDDNAPVGLPGSAVAVPIAADLLREALGPHGARHLRAPPEIERLPVAIEKAGHCRSVVEMFLPNTAPTDRCQPRKSPGYPSNP